MKTTIAALQFTVIASAKITAGQLVSPSGKPASKADSVLGVAISDAEEGSAFPLLAVGIAELVAGATVNVGDKLSADDNGRPIVATADSFGIALSNGGVGSTVTVLIR